MQKKYKVLISGGGTGGHIFPAIAIANEIKAIYPESELEFVGAKGRMEMEKVPAAGYKIHGLWISGLQRRLTPKNLSLPFKVLSSLWESRKIIKRFKPDFTVGVGGYASGPLNYVASKLGVPVYLQEQNSFPGITNKLLKNAASKICVAYDGMERFFPSEKLVLTGNPIRQDVLSQQVSKEAAFDHFGLNKNKKTILIVGGSLGARTVNEAVEVNLEKLTSNAQLVWQTGKNYAGDEGDFSWGKRTTFIKDMAKAYAIADVVISRAGAMSVSELSALGKAVVFVPSPFVAEDHQTKNATNLVEHNAAIICKDVDAKNNLGAVVFDLLNNEKQQQELVKNIKALGKPKAAEDIVETFVKDFESIL